MYPADAQPRGPAVHELLTGRLPSAATISHELTIRLGLTRKKLTHVSINRDEPDRVAFWLQGPTHPTRPGVHGVPVNRIVSLDEKTIKYGECLPKKGRSPAGTPALIRGPAPSSLLSYNVVLAVDTFFSIDLSTPPTLLRPSGASATPSPLRSTTRTGCAC